MMLPLRRLVIGLTTAKDGRTPSVIRIWGLCFAVLDLAMSGSFLAMAWMAAAGRVSMGFDLMSAAQGFSLLMAAQWGGLAAFAAALKWQADVTAGNDCGGGYGFSGSGADGAHYGWGSPRAGMGMGSFGSSAGFVVGGGLARTPGESAGGPGMEGWGGGAG